MARKPGSKQDTDKRRDTARALKRSGEDVGTISEAVGRSRRQIYRYVEGIEEPSKADMILELYGQGCPIPDIPDLAGTVISYVYRVLQNREDKQQRSSAEDQAREYLTTGRFPHRDPNDSVGWATHHLIVEMIDNDAFAEGQGWAWENVERFQAQIHSRRAADRKRSARCLMTQFINLWGASNRRLNNLGDAERAIEMALDAHKGCVECRAEIERQSGWFQHHLWHSCKEEPAYLKASIAHFSESLALYKGIFPAYGHSSHKNGISGVLQGRAASRYYLLDFQDGLLDSREAIRQLDPKKSPNLAVPCTQAYAACLEKTGQRAELDKAGEMMRRVRQDMPVKDGTRYGKVLWLSGLLEDEGEGYLLDARDIFLEKGQDREVKTLTLDLMAYYGDPVRQLRIIESLGFPDQAGSFFGMDFSDLADVWAAAKSGTLTSTWLREVRAELGDELMPDLLWHRRQLGT